MSFSEFALDYNAVGFTPLPVLNKKPCIAGFNKWGGLGHEAVESLSEAHPDADLAILTRLSGLMIVDSDSKAADLVAWVLDEFGYTPLIVSTRRGFHFYYQNPDGVKGVIGDGSFPIDLKGAGKSDFVVAPPSEGYEFVECFLDKEPVNFGKRNFYDFLKVLRWDLPAVSHNGVNTFFPHHLNSTRDTLSRSVLKVKAPVSIGANDNSTMASISTESGPISEGFRNSTLWALGMRYSGELVTKTGISDHVYEALLKQLLKINQDRCEPPMEEAEVIGISENIWYNYQLTGRNNFGKAREPKDIVITVEAIDLSLQNPKAFALLMWLKSTHEPKDTFCLNRDSLAELLGVSDYMVGSCSRYLCSQGYVSKISEAKHYLGIAARYVFTDKANALIFSNDTLLAS